MGYNRSGMLYDRSRQASLSGFWRFTIGINPGSNTHFLSSIQFWIISTNKILIGGDGFTQHKIHNASKLTGWRNRKWPRNWEKSVKKKHASHFKREVWMENKLMTKKHKPSSNTGMQNGGNWKNVTRHAPIDIYTACSFTENSSKVN